MERLIEEIEIYKRLRPKVDNGTLDEIMLDIPTVEAIPIPKGATNGDVIKLVFKSAWDKERTNEEWDEWWNAPYKENEDGIN